MADNDGISQQIANLLAQGERVRSLAVGRCGMDIVAMEGTSATLLLEKRHKTGVLRGAKHGVTSFESGDKVKLEQREGYWAVVTDFNHYEQLR